MRRTIKNPVIKDEVTFTKKSEQTDGEVTELRIKLQPGGGNELHYHKTYDETFTAIDGKLGIRLPGNKTEILLPGESKTIKRGDVHGFFNPEDHDISFRVELRPGHTGFEQSLYILYGLAADGLTDNKSMPKNFSHLAVIAKLSEMRAPGFFFTVMQPIISFLGKQAEKNGLEEELIQKYYK